MVTVQACVTQDSFLHIDLHSTFAQTIMCRNRITRVHTHKNVAVSTAPARSFVSAAFALLCVSAVNCGSCLATANQSAGRGQPTDAKHQLTAAGKRTSDTPASFD